MIGINKNRTCPLMKVRKKEEAKYERRGSSAKSSDDKS
jgi:hypothetical protein